MQHLPILPILIPLLTAALLLLPPFQTMLSRQRWFSGASLLLLVLVSAFGLYESAFGATNFYLLGNWPQPFGIVLVHDRLAAMFVLLTAVLALATWLFSIGGEDGLGAFYHPLLHFLLMGINGAFLTGDLFNLFVFFEVLLISSYGLLMHSGGKARARAGLHYVLMNLAGSAVFLLALALLYAALGTLNIADMAQKISQLEPSQVPLVKAAAGMLLLVFGLKAAVLPLHFWLPSAYSAATPAVAAMFAVMTKIGVYCLLRVFGTLFAGYDNPLADFGQQMLWLAGLATLLLAAMGVVAAQSLKKLIAYLVLVSVGSLISVLAIGTVPAVAAVLYYCLHSTLIAAALFLLADLIAKQRGTVADRLVSGRPLQQPVLLGSLFILAALAVVGMPPLSGFVGKIWLLQAATDASDKIALWSVVLLSSLLVLIALTRAGSTLFWRLNKQQAGTERCGRAQLVAVFSLLLSSPLLVIFGDAVMQFCLLAAQQLHTPLLLSTMRGQ
ncbi:MAG: monovalent cation/H+ antiporter subunit D [Gammaproteobacteria bacterium]|nr:monovalent cation/H+ antiporter subunit D [Gammaproteobacteria bacterium]